MTGNTSTPKARALGRALREARETRKVSLRTLATKLGRDASQLSRWESGYRVPKDTDVARLLAHLGVSNEQCDDILEMCDGATESRWFATDLAEQRQQLASLLEYERDADSITEVSPLLIPGLLQTGAYTRAMMTAGKVSDDDAENRVAIRAGRQATLTRHNPVDYTALIGETALHQAIGPQDTMLEQLALLQAMSQRSNVEVRVIPFSSRWTPASDGMFMLLDTKPVPVVHLENRSSGMFLHEPNDVTAYREATASVREAALTPEQSTALIEQVRRDREARP